MSTTTQQGPTAPIIDRLEILAHMWRGGTESAVVVVLEDRIGIDGGGTGNVLALGGRAAHANERVAELTTLIHAALKPARLVLRHVRVLRVALRGLRLRRQRHLRLRLPRQQPLQPGGGRGLPGSRPAGRRR